MPIGVRPEMAKDDDGNFIIMNKSEDGQYIVVPVTKAKQTVEIDVDALPADVYKEIMLQGLKHFVNGGMGEIKTAGLKDDALAKAQDVAMQVADENLNKIYSGKIRMTKGTRTKVSGAVKTEAMRLARMIIKQAIKDDGGKVSHYSAKDITAAAKEWLETTEEGKECFAQAEKNIKARVETEAKAKIDLSSIKPDPKLVKKADEANAKRKKGAKPPVPGRKAPEHHANA